MTKEEAIKRLELHKHTWRMGGGFDLCDALDTAISALREQECFREATKTLGWISVDERLPEDMGDVLVVAFWHDRWQTMVGWCRKTEAEWRVYTSHGEVKPSGVDYWMPLPEPPEVET